MQKVLEENSYYVDIDKFVREKRLFFISLSRSPEIYKQIYRFNQKYVNFKKYILQRIFSIRNSDDKVYKIITIFGVKWQISKR